MCIRDSNSNSATKWLVIYLGDGTTGTTIGELYNTQEMTLPFDALYHIRWKADNSYTNAEEFGGSDWVDAGWDFTGGVFQTGDYIELRVSLLDLASPTVVDVLLYMLNEEALSEWSYAAVPAGAFADAYDPDAAAWLRFDLSNDAPPNDPVHLMP